MSDQPDDSEPTPERQMQADTQGDRWGDPIGEARQAALRALADQQREWAAAPNHQGRASYFQDVRLTGADVFWLAAYALAGPYGNVATAQVQLRYARLQLEYIDLFALHLEGANLSGAQLEGANLSGANLERANLSGAHLERADLSGVLLMGAKLSGAHLEGANLSAQTLEGNVVGEAHLEGAYLDQAHLEGANLRGAHLEAANLSGAHLEGATLSAAHLEGATLFEARLDGANLRETHLEGKHVSLDDLDRIRRWSEDFPATLLPTDVRGAFFDGASILNGLVLGNDQFGFARLADVRWDGANLRVVDWSRVKILGDDQVARHRISSDGTPKDAATRLAEYGEAARANLGLATALQAQQVNEQAIRFQDHGLRFQRVVWWREREWGNYFSSWIFDGLASVLAGYGYKPLRSLGWYLLILSGFAVIYLALGITHTPPRTLGEVLVISLTAMHGRVFSEQFRSSDPEAVVAAIQAVLGLLIEITFIAIFSKRFFFGR